jgi:hypothetical protein
MVLSNGSSPSVLEEKCSKNEHDAVPVGLCGKGPQNPQAEHSEDISVVANSMLIIHFWLTFSTLFCERVMFNAASQHPSI